MKIDIVCSSGSPIGVIPEYIGGRGVGGAELALMTFAEVMAHRGHEVSVYNNPSTIGIFNEVHYKPLGAWVADESDVLIIFRTPFPQARKFRRKRIFWSCDQFTEGDFNEVFRYVDKIVVISDFHAKYFNQNYQGTDDKMVVVPLGVRTWEYNETPVKDPYHAIYCSVPNRGLEVLRPLWDRLLEQIPDMHLTITSDFRLWGTSEPLNENYRTLWKSARNVDFRGKVPRAELVALQESASYMLYPCTYDELFCIACAECQVAGALPITSQTGALKTTNMFGLTIPGNPGTTDWGTTFIDVTKSLTEHREELFAPAEVARAARLAFDWNIICSYWEQEVLA